MMPINFGKAGKKEGKYLKEVELDGKTIEQINNDFGYKEKEIQNDNPENLKINEETMKNYSEKKLSEDEYIKEHIENYDNFLKKKSREHVKKLINRHIDYSSKIENLQEQNSDAASATALSKNKEYQEYQEYLEDIENKKREKLLNSYYEYLKRDEEELNTKLRIKINEDENIIKFEPKLLGLYGKAEDKDILQRAINKNSIELKTFLIKIYEEEKNKSSRGELLSQEKVNDEVLKNNNITNINEHFNFLQYNNDEEEFIKYIKYIMTIHPIFLKEKLNGQNIMEIAIKNNYEKLTMYLMSIYNKTELKEILINTDEDNKMTVYYAAKNGMGKVIYDAVKLSCEISTNEIKGICREKLNYYESIVWPMHSKNIVEEIVKKHKNKEILDADDLRMKGLDKELKKKLQKVFLDDDIHKKIRDFKSAILMME